jgi:5'-nucleotidase
MRRSASLAFVLASAAAAAGIASRASPAEPGSVTLSIVGTTDLHGYVFARDGRGGLALLGGYLDNLRAARAADGGGVVLIDSGDTFQGGVESDLSEGALVVAAYGALGYTAAVIGNHEFDFGPVDAAGARQKLGSDPRGALRATAARAPFPFLAANLVDGATGRLVEWRNVHASTLVEVAGVKVGLVGVMSIDALRGTLPVNVRGLRVTPLAAAVESQAVKLRAAGAEVVIVGAHAGGACSELANPADLSSCDASAEIFALARALPRGLVDAIAAGHTHQAVAHDVEGVAIVQAYSQGRAFARVDLAFDRRTRRVVGHEIFAPREVCAEAEPATLTCEPRGESGEPRPQARYEGRAVTSSAAVVDAMAPELARVRALQAAELGIVLDTAIPRAGEEESPLGNMFADAQRERTGADVALNNNVRGGLRSDLAAGPLTFGALYDVFPFDNRLLTPTLTGAELRAVLADEVRRNRPGALAVSGIAVRVGCSRGGELEIDLRRASGDPIGADEKLVVAAMDSLVLGPVFAATRPAGVFAVPPEDAPVMREVVEDWLRARGGRLDAGALATPGRPRWQLPAADALAHCVGQ